MFTMGRLGELKSELSLLDTIVVLLITFVCYAAFGCQVVVYILTMCVG